MPADENRTARPYKLLKFSAASLVSSGADLGLFALIEWMLARSASALLVATVAARICSSLLNFTLNRTAVFKERGMVSAQIAKYYVVCVIQMLLSWLLVEGLTSLGLGSAVLLKMGVDVLLFFLSYQVQRLFVFGRDMNARSA